MGTMHTHKINDTKAARRNEASVDMFDGTYSFCDLCRKEYKSKNCCTRVVPVGQVTSPVLLPDEIVQIESYTGINRSVFSVEQNTHNNDVRIMKVDHSGCHFCHNGDCAIYAVRPADCRIFPLDIMEKKDGSLVWIAYTKACPVRFDVETCLSEAKHILPRLINHVREYARASSPWMSGEPYLELGPVEMCE